MLALTRRGSVAGVQYNLGKHLLRMLLPEAQPLPLISTISLCLQTADGAKLSLSFDFNSTFTAR